MLGRNDVDRLDVVIPQYAGVQRFCDETSGNHGAVLDDLCRYVQCIRCAVDIGGFLIERYLYGGIGLGRGGCTGGLIPLHIGIQRFKNAAERYQRAPADDSRRYIRRELAAVYIQVNRKRAGDQHSQQEEC